MSINQACFIDGRNNIDGNNILDSQKIYSQPACPIKIPPNIPTSSLNSLKFVEDPLFAHLYETGHTAYTLPDPSIYKSQQSHVIGKKFQNKLEYRIVELSQLPPSWDGSNAKKILPQTVEYTKSLLSELFTQLSQRTSFVNKFEVFPTIKGGYQFEIRIGRREIEMEYSPLEKIFEILFIEVIGEQEVYQEEQIGINNHKVLMDKLINWLITEDVQF